MNIPEKVNTLQRMSTGELAGEYENLFGKKPRYRSPAWLRKRIAYKIQENAYGGLSVPARAAIERLAVEIEIPGAGPQGPVNRFVTKKSTGLPKPGTVLQREWHDQQIRVTVLEDGIEWNGDRYGSLSAVAKAITGAKWNGRLFFGLTGRAKQ